MGFTKAAQEIKDKISSIQSKTNKEDSDWFDQMQDGQFESTEADNWRWELDFQPEIERYLNGLKRKVRDHKGQWVSLPNKKPYINDDGIDYIFSSLQPILNKGTALGKTSKDEANKITKELTMAFKDKVLRHHEDFEVEKTNIPMLVFGYFNFVRSILSRSENDGERKIRSKMFGFRENYSHDEVSPDEIGKPTL